MYNPQMTHGWRKISSRRASLVVVTFFAFLVPCAIFFILQYRSLKGLERKTRIEAQDNLGQTLRDISQRTKSRLEALAVEAIGRANALDIEQEKLENIENRLTSARQSHAEIDLAFIVVQCPCQKRQFAIFAADSGTYHVSDEQFKANQDAHAIIELFSNASLLRSGN